MLSHDTITAIYDNTQVFPEEAITYLYEISNRLGIPDCQEPECIIEIKDGNVVPPQNLHEEVRNAIQLAFENTQDDENKDALHMKYSYYYDIEKNEAEVLVCTTYCFDGTEALGVDLYTYVISE